MKKIIISIFVFTSFTFCLTSQLQAQTPRYSDGLEHLKMMEQFVGKWEQESDSDTTRIWEFIPNDFGEGYLIKTWVIVKGKPEVSLRGYRGIIGWGGSSPDRQISMYSVSPRGHTHRWVGRFVSEKKLVAYSYNLLHTYPHNKHEWELITPDMFKTVTIAMDPMEENPKVSHQTYTRVK